MSSNFCVSENEVLRNNKSFEFDFWGFQTQLKYGFWNKSFRKDEQPLTSWTLFQQTYLSSKLDFPSEMFWLEENLILSNVLIREESNFDEKNVEEVFNWSEVHSETKYYV